MISDLLKKTNACQHRFSYVEDGKLMDVSPEKLEAKKKGCEILNSATQGLILDIGGEDFYHQYFKGKVEEYNLPKDMHELAEIEKYDGIIAMHVLEHSPFPLLVLENIRRALKPGGYLCLVVPDPEPFIIEDYPEHFSCLTKEGWARLIEFAGLSIVLQEKGTFTKGWVEYRFLAKKS